MRKLLEREFFPFVIKPGRYTGGEQGQITKDHTARLFTVLAVPDLYDYHATNSRLQQLYFTLNANDNIACERVFLPDHDAAQLLKEKKLPLFSLESSTAIKDAKLIFLLVDDPLYFPNCIPLLELAGIPTQSSERNDTHPLIVAVSSKKSNLAPLTNIVDECMISDTVSLPSLHFNNLSKQDLLSQIKSLEKNNSQSNQSAFLAPLIATANSRIEVELSPTRKPNDLAEYVEKGLRATGFDEATITGIEKTYPELEKQVIAIVRAIENKQIELSISPLPPDAFTPFLIDAIKKVSNDPPTINAIAGNERLRSVMGNTASDTHILNAAHVLFERGFIECHLEFLLGCPTEEDTDITAIASLIKQIQEIGQSVTPRTIVVHLSAFTPTPHTPYQWDAIPEPDTLLHKVAILKRQLKSSKIIIKHEDFEKATLRSALTRLHTNSNNLLFAVAAKKTNPDADLLSCWKEAMTETNTSEQELRKPISFSAALPWSLVDVGVSNEELRNRRQTVSATLATPPVINTKAEPSLAPTMEFGRGKKMVASRNTAAPTKNQVRLRWGKDDRTRFMSHLDNMRLMERALRQAQIPVAYSNAKRPTMKISHCHPLPLGFTSEYELIEITLGTSWMPHMIDSLKKALPSGITLYDVRISFGQTQSLSAIINRVTYTLSLSEVSNTKSFVEKANEIMLSKEIIIQREGKSAVTAVDIRPALFDLHIKDNTLAMTLGLGEKGYARPTEIFSLLDTEGKNPLVTLPFHRRELFAVDSMGNRVDGMKV